MSETKDETIARLNGGWDRCREELMQTIKERDEARAEAAATEAGMAALNETIQNTADAILEAEARGYERGVREAAEVLENGGWAIAPDAVLALLEPVTLQKPEA
jgi:uncharacterized coiled-coil DUF342 family protein